MKAYTDVNQSKKLAEILPLESADMRYSPLGDKMHPWVWTDTFIEKDAIPCWSLAALLDVLNKKVHSLDEDGSVDLCDYKNIEWSVCLSNTDVGLFTADNPIDACVAMILDTKIMNKNCYDYQREKTKRR